LEVALGAALGLVSLTVYVTTLYPGVPGGDSGELIAAAYTMGTAHPPGYPLYTMIAKLFTWLPVGSIAWRVNLLSGVLDAAAAVVLYAAVTRWTRSAWAGLLAGGLFAFSPLVWSYAVAAEVFALNNLFIAIVLWLAVRFQERPTTRTGYLLVFVLGLAASNHHTIVLLGLPIVLWMLYHAPTTLRTGPQLLRLTGLFLLGLLPYVYLPLAATNLSVMTWGDFSSVGGFLDHFLRRDYGTFQLGGGAARHDQLGSGLLAYVRDLPGELLIVGPFLAIWGFVSTVRREGPGGLAAVTGYSVALYLLVFGSLANLAFDNALLYGVISRFWQQPNLLVCAWVGLGVAAGTAALRSAAGPGWARWDAPVTAILTIALVACQLARHYERQDQSANTVVADHGRAILESLPPNALLISLGDIDTNPIRYLQLCDGVRTDVRVVDRAMLHYPWTRPAIAANLPDVMLPSGRFSRRDDGNPATAGLTELIELNARQFPIFLSRLNEDEDIAWRDRFRSWPYGTVEWIVPVDSRFDLERYAATSDAAHRALESNDGRAWPETTWEAHVLDRYRDSEFSRGLRLLEHGIEGGVDRRPFELARSVFEDLAAEHPDPPAQLFKNLGLVYQYLSDFDPAYSARMVEWWTRYLRVAPSSDTEVAAIREVVEQASAGD
jgi:SAM-dependent methyltransferase